jgi:hypothetical protein
MRPVRTTNRWRLHSRRQPAARNRDGVHRPPPKKKRRTRDELAPIPRREPFKICRRLNRVARFDRSAVGG